MLIEAEDGHFAQLIEGRAPEGLRVADGGVESAEVLTMLRALAGRIAESFAPNAWLIVEDREIVGLTSLVQSPDVPRTVKLGYGVAGTRRRRGVATRAVADFLRWALADGRVDVVLADTAVTNVGSRRVLETNGFVEIGRRHDPEDGELVCWRRVLREGPLGGRADGPGRR